MKQEPAEVILQNQQEMVGILAPARGPLGRGGCQFNAVQNHDHVGFELCGSLEHRAVLEGHQFSYSDRDAFLVTIAFEEPKER